MKNRHSTDLTRQGLRPNNNNNNLLKQTISIFNNLCTCTWLVVSFYTNNTEYPHR